MIDSRLIELIQHLDKKELKQLQKMVSSPYFNQNIHIIRLFDFIYKLYPKFTASNCSKQKAYTYIYEDKTFNDKRMRNLMSDLKEIVEDALVHLTFEENEVLSNEFLLKELQTRNLNNQYDTLFAKQSNIIEGISKENDDRYRWQHRLYEVHYDYTLLNDFKASDDALFNVLDNLDTYFILKKLKYSCEILNRRSVLANQYEQKLLPELTAFVQSSKYANHPAVKVYMKIIELFENPTEEQLYFELKTMLNDYNVLFNHDENGLMYTYARNYCIRRIKRGEVQFYNELHALYIELLETGILFEGGEMLQSDFKNICTIGLHLGKYDWVEDFIDQYQHKLVDATRENSVTYNKAHLAFYRGNYAESMQLLVQVEFVHIHYAFSARELLLMCYFELDEEDAFESLVNSYKVYLRRMKKAQGYNETQIMSSYNFITVINQLFRLKQKGQKVSEKLTSEIEEMTYLSSRVWLTEKMAKLTGDEG